MEKVKVKIIKEKGVDLPKYMTEESAGMDIKAFIKEPIILGSLERVLVPTGIKLEILKGYEVQVRPRSGLAIKHGITLLNTPGTIDSDYRGEIKVVVKNLSEDFYNIVPGQKIAQIIIQAIANLDLKEEKITDETDRQTGGFGSTGKF